MNELKRFGKKIKKLRIERGISQEELAAKTGRTPAWIRRLESGQAKVLTVGQIQKLCRALGVRVEITLE